MVPVRSRQTHVGVAISGRTVDEPMSSTFKYPFTWVPRSKDKSNVETDIVGTPQLRT